MRRRTLVIVASVALVVLHFAAPAAATETYSDETGFGCTYCHETPGGPLTAQGEIYRANGHRFPFPTGSPGTSAAPSQPAATGVGPFPSTWFTLASWQRTAVLSLHILAAFTWLGGIVVVFFVQTPRVAAAGIPRGYLRLGWAAIATVGVTGLILIGTSVTAWSQFTDNHWGRVLIAKIAVYALLLASAAAATFILSPRLRRSAERQSRRGSSLEQYKAQGRMAVRYHGRVYDVTGSRLWPEGRHARRHDAWQDLTEAMSRAPHGAEVFERFAVLADAGTGPPPVMRVFFALTCLNLALIVTEGVLVAAW